MQVRRGFVGIAEGDVHYRAAGQGGVPLVMFHPSPFSALVLEPLVAALGEDRRVVAPDTLGNGDSCAPAMAEPDIAYFAEASLRVLDALGISQADLYGAHTGARIATHIALTHPDRVRKIVLDGFGLYAPDALQEILATYAPAIAPDDQARHLIWAWHFVRDQHLFFPWFKRDAAHRYARDMPDAARLHALFLETAKAIGTYHLSYRAAFRYSMAEHLPRLRHPVLLAFCRDDMVFPQFEAAQALLPEAAAHATPGCETAAAARETAAILRAFLDD
jgi:pimeloyl-ACP methyl ester carboxylesterase